MLFRSWHPDGVELFRRLDRKLWDVVHHNPVKMLGAIDQEKLAAAAQDEGYLSHLSRVYMMFKAHLGESVLFPRRLGTADELASMVVELITNDYMNAETIRVDGGIRMPPK